MDTHPVERDWSFAQITVDEMTIIEVITELMNVLGPTLTALLSGTRDRAMPDNWLLGQEVPAEAVERLRAGLTCVRLIAFDEGDDYARRMMVGANQLTGNAVALDIRNGQISSVREHLTRFAVGTAD